MSRGLRPGAIVQCAGGDIDQMRAVCRLMPQACPAIAAEPDTHHSTAIRRLGETGGLAAVH